jgi:ABC-2 type transport system ATP-binding protein
MFSERMGANFALDIINLVKRYPTTARGNERGGPRARMGASRQVNSLAGVFDVFKRNKGPFIEALRGVNLQIGKGEVFGLLGPNGAGKTTLIKILCTLVIPDDGKALVNHIDVQKQPTEVLKNLQAVLPESRGFTWRLSGRQNLDFFALLYGLNKRQTNERVNFVLELTGLRDRADDSYQRYSTGMQRKLLLSRALLRDTPVLVFDEPTAGLDPTSSVEFRHLLRDKLAREQGKTIFLSTHNLPEAQDICDRIAILDRGRITACDTPANIQHTMSNEKVVDIAFVDATFTDDCIGLLDKLEKMPGVFGLTPEITEDRQFERLSIRVDKDMVLSDVLQAVMNGGLKIRVVNTEEPTLEDAFIAITRRTVEERGRPPKV